MDVRTSSAVVGKARAPRPPGRSVQVLLALTRAEVRDHHDLTVLGFAKWMLEPLSFMAVYFLLVAVLFQRGGRAYPLFVLSALLPWRYFQGTTGGSMSLVNRFSTIVSTRALPRGILPLVPLLSEVTTFSIGLLLAVPLMIAYDSPFTPALLWTPVVTLVLMVLCAGPAYILTVFGVYFPDFRAAVGAFLRIGFFASTALVARGKVVRRDIVDLLQINPLSGIFDSYRAIFMDGRAPEPARMLYPLGVGLALLTVGVLLYRWREFEFPKEV